MPNVLRVTKNTYEGQLWSGYPASPVSTEIYPYQLICMGYETSYIYLYCSGTPIYRVGNYLGMSAWKRFRKPWGSGASFTWEDVGGTNDAGEIYEANNNVFTNADLVTVAFGKNTTTTQDAGIILALITVDT